MNVGDIDRVAELVGDAGGRVAFGPADVAGTGRIATLLDPQGAAFAIFAPTAT